MLIYIVIILLLVAAGGAGYYFYFMKKTIQFGTFGYTTYQDLIDKGLLEKLSPDFSRYMKINLVSTNNKVIFVPCLSSDCQPNTFYLFIKLEINNLDQLLDKKYKVEYTINNETSLIEDNIDKLVDNNIIRVPLVNGGSSIKIKASYSVDDKTETTEDLYLLVPNMSSYYCKRIPYGKDQNTLFVSGTCVPPTSAVDMHTCLTQYDPTINDIHVWDESTSKCVPLLGRSDSGQQLEISCNAAMDDTGIMGYCDGQEIPLGEPLEYKCNPPIAGETVYDKNLFTQILENKIAGQSPLEYWQSKGKINNLEDVWKKVYECDTEKDGTTIEKYPCFNLASQKRKDICSEYQQLKTDTPECEIWEYEDKVKCKKCLSEIKYGDICELEKKPNKCESGWSPENAICQKCMEDYYGEKCSFDIKEVLDKYPKCDRDKWEFTGDGFKCSECPTDLYGDFCTHDINEAKNRYPGCEEWRFTGSDFECVRCKKYLTKEYCALNRDVGQVYAAGSFDITDGVHTVRTNGWEIGRNSDGFHFVFTPYSGDSVLLQARIVKIEKPNQYSNSTLFGLMIRENFDANSIFHFVYNMENGATRSMSRKTTGGYGGINNIHNPISGHSWIRLVRNGDTFTSHVSKDGVNWTLIDTQEIPGFKKDVYIGIAAAGVAQRGVLASGQLDNLLIAKSEEEFKYRYCEEIVDGKCLSCKPNHYGDFCQYDIFPSRQENPNCDDWNFTGTGFECLRCKEEDGYYGKDENCKYDLNKKKEEYPNCKSDKWEFTGQDFGCLECKTDYFGEDENCIHDLNKMREDYPNCEHDEWVFEEGQLKCNKCKQDYYGEGDKCIYDLNKAKEDNPDCEEWTFTGDGFKCVKCKINLYEDYCASGKDIGSVSNPGSFDIVDGVYILQSYGKTIQGTQDSVYFVNTMFKGDVVITAQITEMEQARTTRFGIMVRETLDPNSRYFVVSGRKDGLINLFWRETVGGSVRNSGSGTRIAFPLWIRLKKEGSTFSGYYSQDGNAWTHIYSRNIPGFNEDMFIGIPLATNSIFTNALSIGKLKNFTIEPL